jgi:hypothetical protein
VRINQIMSITEFKRKIAQKYETSLDNIIVSNGDREFKGNSTNLTNNVSTLMSRMIGPPKEEINES